MSRSTEQRSTQQAAVPWGEGLLGDERFRLLAENASDIIYLYRLTPRPGYEYVSPSVTRITGYTPHEHYADPKLAFKMVHPHDEPILASLLRAPETFTDPVTVRFISKGEQTLWTEHRVAPIHDSAGTLVAVEGIARDITDRRLAELELWQTVRTLRSMDSDRRNLLNRLVDAEEQERRRLSVDLHDDHIQVMAAVALRIEALRLRLSKSEHEEELRSLEETVRDALERLRTLSFDLHPPVLDREGLCAALRVYAEKAWEQTGTLFFVEDHLTFTPPPEASTILYRIAQEALANVRKHAQASKVHVLLEERDGGIVMRIHDDGVGFSPEEAVNSMPGHLGLASMRERAKLAGGQIAARSSPGFGTTVQVTIPTRPPLEAAS